MANISAIKLPNGTTYTLIDSTIPAVVRNIGSVDISNWNGKQDTLVSGTNIKTVQGSSILGSGNVSVHSAVAVTISVANWNATTTCTKSVTGVTASNNIVVSPDPTSMDDYIDAGIVCTAQASGTLTFTCNTTPSSSIVVNVLIYN